MPSFSAPLTPLILAAMAEEEAAVVTELGGPSAFTEVELDSRLGIRYRQLRQPRGGRGLLLARSGIGPVNAALTLARITQAHPEVDAVLLLGVGGALTSDLAIGDLVLSRAVLQHDYYFSLDFGHVRVLPGALVLTSDEADGHIALQSADPGLLAWVQAAAPDARVGTVLSGNEFAGTIERKRAIAQLHSEALLVEMEAAGVAQVATRLGIPFVVAKTVADRLTPDGSIEQDFRTCLHAASAHAATILRNLLA